MKINEKTLFAFANTKPSDKEGFLLKRGEVNKAFQRRWFVLKGNLLFYFEKKGDYEPAGCIILEGCIIELAEEESERFCFQLIFHGNRTYVMSAESQETMESWMKALTTAGYDYMKLLISELQRQLDELDKSSSSHQQEIRESVIRPPRRQNPFNKSNCNGATTSSTQRTLDDVVVLRRQDQAPPLPPRGQLPLDSVRYPIPRDDNEMMSRETNDFSFLKIHEEFGVEILKDINERKALKEKAEQPLIVL